MRTQEQTYDDTAGKMPNGIWPLAVRLIASALVALLAASAAWALRSPAEAQSTCGRSFIQQAGAADVYLVKTENGQRFKRLMLNEAAFEAYDCPWEAIRTVSVFELDSYRTSILGRVPGEDPVYRFRQTGDDSGVYRHLRMTRSELERAGYDWDAVFLISEDDLKAYTERPDITCSDLDVCDPSQIENLPPIINVRGPLTLTAGQQVTGLHIATVTDPDNTLWGENMSVYGLPGGWTHTYNQSGGHLTISGAVPSGTASIWTVRVHATDGAQADEQTLQITVESTNDNRPPIIDVRGPLTLIAGQQVTGLYVATVTDPDDTLSSKSMEVRGLYGVGWEHTYDSVNGRLTISGTVPSVTTSSWAASVYVTDDTQATERPFQVTVVGDPALTNNQPPTINVRGPLTLIAGQQVTGLYVATVTDPDDTLSSKSMEVRGLYGVGWEHTYDSVNGRLTISGIVPSDAASSWAATVKADDGTETSEQAFQITILEDTSSGTSTLPVNANVALSYDNDGGCQLSDADGRGQPSYQPGEEVLLSCPVNNTDSTSRWTYLRVALQHSATGRWRPVHPVDQSAAKKAPTGIQRQWARFAVPADWPDGDTTADVTLGLWEPEQWLDRNTQTAGPFKVRTEPDYDGPYFIRATLSDSELVAGDDFVIDLTVQCSATQSQRLWFIASLARAGELLSDADNDNQHECPAGQTIRIARAFAVLNNASPGEYLTRVTLADASVGKAERVIWYHGSSDIFPRHDMTLRIVPEIIDLPRPQKIPEPSFQIDIGEFAKGLAGEAGLWFFNSDCDKTFERMLGCLMWAFNPVTDAIDTTAWLVKQCVIKRLIGGDQESCTLTELGLTLLGVIPIVGDGAEIIGTLNKMARVDLDKMLALLKWGPFEGLLNSSTLSFLGGARKIANDVLASSFRRSLDDAVTRIEASDYGPAKIFVDNAELTRTAQLLGRQLNIDGLAEAVEANPMPVAFQTTRTATSGEQYTFVDTFYGLFDLYRRNDDKIRTGQNGDAAISRVGAISHMKALAQDHAQGWRIKAIEWEAPNKQRADTINEMPDGTKIWQEVKTASKNLTREGVSERIALAVDARMDRVVFTFADEVRETSLFSTFTPPIESLIRDVAKENGIKVEVWVRYLGNPKLSSQMVPVFKP